MATSYSDFYEGSTIALETNCLTKVVVAENLRKKTSNALERIKLAQ